MKLSYRHEPSRNLVRAAFWLRNKVWFLRWPLAIVLAATWITLIPPSWLIIKLSSYAHSIAGWCGFDSRDWE